jgi:hypothetical protein
MLLSLCRWSSATAMAGRNRPLSSQISPDQGIAMHVVVSTGPRELTEILPVLPVYRSAQSKAHNARCHLPQPRFGSNRSFSS